MMAQAMQEMRDMIARQAAELDAIKSQRLQPKKYKHPDQMSEQERWDVMHNDPGGLLD
jgi:hypothetical protein